VGEKLKKKSSTFHKILQRKRLRSQREASKGEVRLESIKRGTGGGGGGGGEKKNHFAPYFLFLRKRKKKRNKFFYFFLKIFI